MKVSLSWLNQYVTIGMPIGDLVEALTMVGLEIESVTDRYQYLESVIVGAVTEVKAHPHADRLKVCRVDIGEKPLSVVCGAPNVKTGQHVPLALPGTLFPDGSSLEESVIRNVASEGMICSEAELGLGTDASGVMVLDVATRLGTPLATALELEDTILEIDLTPNRPDCLSIIGVAREVAAIQKTELRYPDFGLEDSANRISEFTSVTVEAPDLCPRYSARMITGIKVAPSPFWLQDRLLSVGLRPINNIVDITNFMLMETGQPMHAFDFDQLAENRIVVKTADKGERFTTLDEKERLLTAENLMICDGEKAVGIGGVMGGLNSEIEDTTTSVLLESAYFNPISIRKTSKKLGLHTEAAHRFERGMDPEGTVKALNRASKLMAELGGGTIVPGLIDEYPAPVAPRTIPLSVADTNRLLGTHLDSQKIRDLLESIEFSTTSGEADRLDVKVPSFRVDVSRPQDLMEEVARLSGYNHIPTTFPVMPSETRKPSKLIHTRRLIRNLMGGFGFSETINYSFIGKNACDQLRLSPDDPRRKTISIVNPLSEEQTVMRTSLLPGLLSTMDRNVAKQIKTQRLFEVGKIYMEGGENSPAIESEMLATLWTGLRNDPSWHAKDRACDFFDIKGIAEGLLRGLGMKNISFTALTADLCRYTRPGFTAQVRTGSTQLGLVGEIHPQVLEHFGLKQTAYIFEFDLNCLVELRPEGKQSESLPKFPSMARDVTLIIDRGIETVSVLEHVTAQKEMLVEGVHLFDVYQGKPIPEDKKSISFRIVYRSETQTLEDEEINPLHEKISKRIIEAFDAGLPA